MFHRIRQHGYRHVHHHMALLVHTLLFVRPHCVVIQLPQSVVPLNQCKIWTAAASLKIEACVLLGHQSKGWWLQVTSYERWPLPSPCCRNSGINLCNQPDKLLFCNVSPAAGKRFDNGDPCSNKKSLDLWLRHKSDKFIFIQIEQRLKL